MKYLDEYRSPEQVRKWLAAIRRVVTKPHTLMEVCGGQTHTIVKYGLDTMLPPEVTLIHGPGCPVCVTPLEMIDRALALARRPEVIFCSFGDMLRVPGSQGDLFSARADGGDVRVVYSPMDAVALAMERPDKEVVFFAVGFETTAPPNAMAVYQAKKKGLGNFSLLVSHVLVPPAIEMLLSSPDNRVQGFLAAGHVCTVMGYEAYEDLAKRYQVPIVVTGFEPLDILQGVYACVKQREEGRYAVVNQYARSVIRQGNRPAREIMEEVFEVVPRRWRGIGTIDRSGLGLRPDYAVFDAERRFAMSEQFVEEPSQCLSGAILQGLKKPYECPAFSRPCSPAHPLGAPMVSSEGACAAYYRYRQHAEPGESK